MNDKDLERLNLLLSVEEKIRGHSGYPNIKKAIADELRAIDAPPAVDPVASRIYPADSGVVERGPDTRRR